MNLGQFRNRVRLQLGNLPDAHPMMEFLDTWINEAIRDLPQRDISLQFDRRTLFPELTRDTLVQPSANQSWVEAPKHMLAPLYMHVFYSQEVPNLDFDQQHPVSKVDYDQIKLMQRETTSATWTRLYAWFNSRLYLWPTPVEGNRGWLSFTYLYEAPYLTEPEHEPLINPRWDAAICDLATAYGEAAQSHEKRAAHFYAQADSKVTRAANWIGRSDQTTPQTVKIYGDVESMEIYD